MGIQDYVQIIRKRWFSILLCIVIGLVAASAYVLSRHKIYTASAQIFVAATASDSTSALNNGNTFAQARVQSYTNVVNSPDVTDAVVRKLKLSITPDQLAGQISADAPLNKVILNIHVTDHSASEAARLANGVATQLVTYVEQIEQTSSGAVSSPVKLTVIHPAQVPSSPTSPNVKLDLIIGVVVGILAGIGLALLRDNVDTRIRTADDVTDASGVAVLASIPRDRGNRSDPIAALNADQGLRAEAVRQLRANLQYIAVDSPPKVIVVSSALSGEGKSTTAVNLAIALAETGKKVSIVDADLRRPSIADYLKLPTGAGLTAVLAGAAGLSDVMQQAGDNLSVLTSGQLPPNPSELLSSGQFRSVLQTLSEQYDWVIVDTAPLLPVADGREVASAADACLLVVHSSRTNRDQLRQGVAALDRVGANLAGVVLNMVPRRDRGRYDQYYSAQAPKTEAVAASSTRGLN